MKKNAKEIEVILKPSDFKNTDFTSNQNCALARAAKRHFKTKNIICGSFNIDINGIDYVIKDAFTGEDYAFVEAKYKKDPKMEKVCYMVTLTLND